MRKRAAFRWRWRSANLRYRARRFDNRRRPEGWLPPSLKSRVDNGLSWVRRYRRLSPVVCVEVEAVRFDTQRLQNPEISGIDYQRGDLFGYEVREYMLEKWGRRCASCGAEGGLVELDHVVPTSRGGTDRVSNLTVACRACNQTKGNRGSVAVRASGSFRVGTTDGISWRHCRLLQREDSYVYEMGGAAAPPHV